MRKLILQMQYSLDGFVSGPNEELDWIFPDLDAAYAAWGVERLWRAGAHVMGGATCRDMAAHWPSSTEPYAAPMNQIPKVVFSGSLKSAGWADTRIVSGDLAKEIARLKQERGRDLLVPAECGLPDPWSAPGRSTNTGSSSIQSFWEKERESFPSLPRRCASSW